MMVRVLYVDTSSNPSNCSYTYIDNIICSQCKVIKDDAKQQIALLPMNYSEIITNGIIISDPKDLNIKTCSYIDSENYYAVNILVTESEDVIQYPIAMKSVHSISKGTTGKRQKAMLTIIIMRLLRIHCVSSRIKTSKNVSLQN